LNPLYAALLGLIQGLTEFLPISSTAHLTLAGKLLGVISSGHPEAWTEFMAVMQLGTLVAVMLYFRHEIVAMIRGFFGDLFTWGHGRGFAGFTEDGKMAVYIVIGTLPVGVIGFALKRVIEGSLTKTTIVIASSLVALALLLWLAEKVASRSREIQNVGWLDALLIGIAQACALIPGSSRSGTTMTAALFLGFSRPAAARFSFLLSIPAVFASGLYEMSKIHGEMFDLGVWNLVISTVVAGISGYAAIAWLLRYLMKNTTMVFVWYRILLGAGLFILLYLQILQN
jgi:undecaprenyl-diphosphatase